MVEANHKTGPVSPFPRPGFRERIGVALVGGILAFLFGMVISTGCQRMEFGDQVPAPEAYPRGALSGVGCGLVTSTTIFVASRFLRTPHGVNRWCVGLVAGLLTSLVCGEITMNTIYDFSLSDRMLAFGGPSSQYARNAFKAQLGGIVSGMANAWLTASSLIVMGKTS
jgi:hypothetical protein